MMLNIKRLMVLLVILPILAAQYAYTCDIQIKASSNEPIKVNEESIVIISLSLKHRNCPVAPEETKIETDGIKILSATKWKEIDPGKYERKLKITAEKAGEVSIFVSRTCKRDGGEAKLVLKAVQ